MDIDIPLLPPTLMPWQPQTPERAAAVLMSGGVDSSITALLLQEAGYDVCGFTMQIPTPAADHHPAACCGSKAWLVCVALGIPHYFLDTRNAFAGKVIAPFRQAYASGRTPSPCIICNAVLKFGLSWRAIEEHFGPVRLATGHYARCVMMSGRTALLRSRTPQDDQSYFLYGLDAAKLPRLLLPMGERTKSETRKLAERRGLAVATKPESMELCFAGEGDYRLVLGEAGTGPAGDILDEDGRVIGRHSGIHHYTIGQRQGLGIAKPYPQYVIRIIPEKAAIVVGRRECALARRVAACCLNWLAPEVIMPGRRAAAKIRSSGEPAPCEIIGCGDDRLEVVFDQPVFAPAPGQHLVLYDGDRVLGGGMICGSDLDDRSPQSACDAAN